MTRRQSLKVAAIVAAMVVPTTAWAAQQPPGQPTAGVALPASQAALTECAQAQPMAERTIDAATRRIEAARQANSPAAMRAAIDEMQAALRQLRSDIAPCAAVPSLAAAGPPAGHVMPGTRQAPAAGPGALVVASGPAAPPAARPPAGPAMPAGHAMPAAPSAPTARPNATPRAAAPAPRSAPTQGPAPTSPAGAGAHAGHQVQAAPQPAGSRAPEASSQAVDQVCGLKVDPSTAPRATHQGRTYYFCSEQHRQLFVKDPVRYVPKERR